MTEYWDEIQRKWDFEFVGSSGYQGSTVFINFGMVVID